MHIFKDVFNYVTKSLVFQALFLINFWRSDKSHIRYSIYVMSEQNTTPALICIHKRLSTYLVLKQSIKGCPESTFNMILQQYIMQFNLLLYKIWSTYTANVRIILSSAFYNFFF